MTADAAARLHDAWNDFCAQLRDMGDVIAGQTLANNDLDQAEGYRFLCRLLHSAFENAFEHSRQPALAFREKDPYLHVGFTSPDQDPLTCAIDPTREYRITGTRGTNAGLGILAMDPSDMQHASWLNHDQLTLDHDGRFEIVASREKPASGDWLPLSDTSSLLVIRCNFNDRASEVRATFEIEEVGADPARRPISANDVIRGLRGTILSSRVMLDRMVEWAQELVTRPNVIGDLQSYRRSSGSPDHDFRFGYFELSGDEAIEVSFVPPPCDNWQFQIGNWWVENLDNYDDLQGWCNQARAEVSSDGRVVLLASPEPVNATNWIDTFGRRTGIMGLRFVKPRADVEVTVRVIEREQVLRA
jgi:hypothetical protein